MFGKSLRAATTAAITGLTLAVAGIGLSTSPAAAQSSGGFQIIIGPNGIDLGRPNGFGPGFDRHGPRNQPDHAPNHGIRPDFIGETGLVRVRQNDRRQWHQVALRQRYSNPVVILGPLTKNGIDPAIARVGQVGPRGFRFRIEEWAYLDGSHRAETVGYMVVEAGRHELANGDVLTAGIANNIDQGWSRIRVGQRFDEAPVVLTTVVGGGRGLPVVPRIRNVNLRGFGVRLQKEEAANELVRRPRSVAWVALEPGRGRRDVLPYIADVTPARVDETGFPVRLRRPALAARLPVLLASIQTFNGPDPAGLRYARGPRGVRMFVEEERSANNETNHANEKVGYAMFAVGFIEAATPPGRQYLGGRRNDDDNDGRGRRARNNNQRNGGSRASR